MKLAVLDATAVGGGPVSRALDCAAREAGRGAEVTHVRLYRLFTSACAACSSCSSTGRCSARSRQIDAIAETLLESDLLLVGVLSGASQRDVRAEALLRRLVASFGNVYDSRHGECSVAESGRSKAAGLICSAPPLFGSLAAIGAFPYGLGSVWRVLERAGVDVVGSASVARLWTGPASWDETRERAARLGRLLGASVERRPVAVPARESAPLPAPAPAPAGVRVA